MELAVMMKFYPVLITMYCIMVSPLMAKTKRITLAPQGSISLHKRSLSGLTSQTKYLGEIAHEDRDTVSFEQLVNNFVDHPFGIHVGENQAQEAIFVNAPLYGYLRDTFLLDQNGVERSAITTGTEMGADGTLTVGDDPGMTGNIPGTVYLGSDYKLYKVDDKGTISLANQSDAIKGDKIWLVNSTDNLGKNFLPVANLGESNDTGTILSIYPIIQDGLTHQKYPEFDTTDTNFVSNNGFSPENKEYGFSFSNSANNNHTSTPQPFVTYSDNGLLTFVPTSHYWDGNAAVESRLAFDPKPYIQPNDLTASYYFIPVGYLSPLFDEHTHHPDVTYDTDHKGEYFYNTSFNGTETTNNYRHLVEDTYFNQAALIETANEGDPNIIDGYTQHDYDQINYYAIDLGLHSSYPITNFLALAGYIGLSAPLENVEHNGRFISFQPEIEINMRAGLLIGGEQGSIGMMYGITHERFSTQFSHIANQDGYAVLEEIEHTHEKTYQHTSLCANIQLTDSLSAAFSTAISEDNLSVDMEPVTDTRFINQSYSFGISLSL